MSSPDKPWESSSRFQNTGLNRSSEQPGLTRNELNGHSPFIVPNQPIGTVRNIVLPPVPPLPVYLSAPNRPMFGVLPSMYGGSPGYSGYGGFSTYGSYPGSMYGGYSGGYGYGSYGHPNNAFNENRFMQAAEESSRSAFQSIESLVRSFASVSMMLESTYYAMQTSFRAVLGVVDNFSRLRQMFAHFLSAITFLKIVQDFYRRLLHWLGIMDQDPRSDQVWKSVVSGEVVSSSANSSTWALLTFFGVLFGGPYLVSKFFFNSEIEPKKWDPKNGVFYRAAHPYEAASEAELSFRQNELINVAPVEFQQENGGGWVLAANCQGKVGHVPVTRLGNSVIRTGPQNVIKRSTNPRSSAETQD